jgi:hypothetical protein
LRVPIAQFLSSESISPEAEFDTVEGSIAMTHSSPPIDLIAILLFTALGLLLTAVFAVFFPLDFGAAEIAQILTASP